jgi:hypothetical protein
VGSSGAILPAPIDVDERAGATAVTWRAWAVAPVLEPDQALPPTAGADGR